MSALQLHTTRRDQHWVVSLIGPLTHHTTSTLRDYLRLMISETASPPGELLLDLGRCINVDTDGLLALNVAQHAARTRGGNLHLVRVPPLIERLIHQYNLDHLLHPDPAQGISRATPASRAGVGADLDPEAPEADTAEQHVVVTHDFPDDPNSSRRFPLEADPADVDDQHRVVPFDDEDRDDPTDPPVPPHTRPAEA